MKNLLFIFLLLSLQSFASDPISCAPERKTVAAAVSTVRDGDWFSGSTWSTGKVPSEYENISINHYITSKNKSIIIRGELSGRRGGLTFTGINTKLFKDGVVDMKLNPVLNTNIGLYVLGSGRLNINGEEKIPWTLSASGLKKGARQITVNDARGWNVGDEIFISPTGIPPVEPGLGEKDVFAKQFERRIIRAISGNTITIDALTYDHPMVDNQFAPEIGNLTRSFKVGGTKGSESFIFIHSNQPQTFRYSELSYTGGGQRTGVYAFHMHHMMDGSRGSIIEGNAAHDNNFRVFVPHMSHGVTINNNVMFDQYGQALWYDFQNPTHDQVWTNNLIALTRVRPGVMVSESIDLGQGENNKCNFNTVVYGSTTNARIGDRAALGVTPLLENRGAYNWHADNMGRPWEFIGNKAHSNVTAGWMWVNSPWYTHPVQQFTAFNNWRGFFNGAYINGILIWDSYFYDSPIELKATSGNDVGNSVVRTKMVSSGRFSACAYVQDSPIESGASNKFADCEFIGKIGVVCFSPKKEGDQFKQPKWVELLGCTFSGTPYQIHSSAHKRTRVTMGESPDFGRGTGLRSEVFSSTNLKGESLVYLDYGVRHYSTWTKTIMESPTGPSRIVDDKFSVRWTGYYEPQVSGQHSFSFEGSAGVRLWVDNRLIIDSWVDKIKETDIVNSSLIALAKGKRVPFRMEVFNDGGKRRAILKANGKDIPMFQFYPAEPIPEPEPNKPPVIDAGPDIIDTALAIVIKGTASDDGPLDIQWNKLSGGSISFEKLTDPTNLYLRDFAPSEYVFEMVVTDSLGLVARDTVKVTALMPPIVTHPCTVFDEKEYLKANPDVANEVDIIKSGKVTKRKNFRSGLEHYNKYGKNENRPLSLNCVFTNRPQTGSISCPNGKDTTITIPAGKHNAASQSLADALALQDLNNQLSNVCPTEIARYELQGKTIIVYSDWTIIIK